MIEFNNAQISILKQGLWALISNEEDWLSDDRAYVAQTAVQNIGFAKLVLRTLEDYQLQRDEQ